MKKENPIKQEVNFDQRPIVDINLREQSLEWFFRKSEVEKMDLKEIHFPNLPIQHSRQWGLHFTFGQIEEMYVKEHK